MQGSRFDQMAQNFLDKERIALLFAQDRAHERLATPSSHLLLVNCLDEVFHLVLRESSQQHSLVKPLASQFREHCGERVTPVEFDVAIRADHDQSAALDAAREMLQEQQRRLVGPVQVVELQHNGIGLRRVD